MKNPSDATATFAAANGYATAIWTLTCAADDRDKTAAKLRDWADEERPNQKRTEAEESVMARLWSEANELRAAAEVLKSHTDQAL